MRRFAFALSALTLLGTFVAFAGPAPIGTVTTAPGGAPPTPIATTSTAGKVKPDGTTITVTPDGTISAAAAPPVASATVSGTVKIGTGLAMDQDGKLNNTGVAGVASFGTPPRAGAVKPGFNDYSASMIKGLAAVAKTGNYADLSGKPTIPAPQVNSDWSAVSGAAQILNKPTVPTALSQLTQSPSYRTVTDTEKAKWDSQSNAVTKVNDKTGNVVLSAVDVGADPLGAATSVQGNLDLHEGLINNPHEVTKAQVGLGNADNTSDAEKPVSTATQAALKLKADGYTVSPTGGDDGAVINAAFAVKKHVVLAEGAFHMTTPIVVPAGATLEGPATNSGAIVYTNVAGDYSIKILGTLGTAGPTVNNVTLKNFQLRKEGANLTSGIKVSAAANFTMDGVKVHGMNGGPSLLLEQVWDSWFARGYVHSSSYAGPATVISYGAGGSNDNSNNLRFTGWTWESNQNTEIDFQAGSGSNNVYNIVFDSDCKIERADSNAAPLITVSSGTVFNVSFKNAFILARSTAATPFLLDVTGDSNTTMRNWQFEGGNWGSSSTSGAHPGLIRLYRAKGVSFKDVRFTLWDGTFASMPVITDASDDYIAPVGCSVNGDYAKPILSTKPASATVINTPVTILHKEGSATKYVKTDPMGASGSAEISSDGGPTLYLSGSKLGVGRIPSAYTMEVEGTVQGKGIAVTRDGGTGGTSYIWSNNPHAPTDQKNWDIFQSDASWQLRLQNDAYSAANPAIRVDRSGATPTAIQLTPGTGGVQVKDGGATVASIGSDGKITGSSLAVPHASTHATGQPDAIAPADIGAATAVQGAKADSAVQPSTSPTFTGISVNGNITSTAMEVTNDGANTQQTITTYSTFTPQILFRSANGTSISPAATGVNKSIFALFGTGHDGTDWISTASAAIVAKTAEVFSTTARGSYITFQTTASTTTSRTEKMRVHGSGGVSIGNTTDPGAGNLILNGKLQTQNVEEKSAILTAASNVFTPDLSQGSTFVVTLAATNTIANPTNIPANGRVTTFTMLLKQDATGNRTVGTWGTAYNFGDAGTPILTTTANKKDIVTCLVAEGAISGCFLSGTGF